MSNHASKLRTIARNSSALGMAGWERKAMLEAATHIEHLQREVERLAEVIEFGGQCATGITGDPEDAANVRDVSTALLAIRESVRLGYEAHNERIALKAQLAEREVELDQQTRDCIAAIREAQDRGARLAEAEAAAKTWENEAERRSRRYEMAAARLAEVEAQNERLCRKCDYYHNAYLRLRGRVGDSAASQPPVPRDSELRQQIGEDMAKFYQASQPTKAHGLDCQQYEDGSAPCTCGATPQPTDDSMLEPGEEWCMNVAGVMVRRDEWEPGAVKRRATDNGEAEHG